MILSGQDDVPERVGHAVSYQRDRTAHHLAAAVLVIGHTDDWLRLVLAHEFTHIVHLDRSRGMMTAARCVFGRAPFVMPNLFLPTWQIEGVATWQESAIDG